MSTDVKDVYGSLVEPDTLTIQRMLPGPAERIWKYLTDSDLRRKWLAAGTIKGAPGEDFELVWRNEELNTPKGRRPEGFAEEQRMPSRVVEFDPPRKLVISWRDTGDVTFELAPRGDKVLLTIVHRRFADRATLLKHMAGWHAHLDVLEARASDREPASFWPNWQRLNGEYQARLPA